jgi:hypothetical protein
MRNFGVASQQRANNLGSENLLGRTMFDKLRQRLRSFPKTAVCLHISHPALANVILEHLEAITAPFTLFVSYSHPLPDAVFEKLEDIKKIRCVETYREVNIGLDILPFLYLLPRLMRFDIVCKLHTKHDLQDSESALRDLFIEPLIGSDASFCEIVHYLGSHRTIGMLGPADLYMSSQHLLENDKRDLNKLLAGFAPDMIGSEWGFFAGGMFWARPKTLFPIYDLAVDLETAWRYEDCEIARGVEPIFGLLPAMQNQKNGVLDLSDNGLRMRELEYTDKPERDFIGSSIFEVHENREQASVKSVRERAAGLVN